MQVRFLLGSPMFISVYVSSKTIRLASFVTPHNPTIIDYLEIPNTKNFDKDLVAIFQSIDSIATKNIFGIGVSVPGMLDPERTHIVKSVNLTTWEHKPLKDELENRYKCEVILENNTTAAAMSEAIYGQGRDENFLFIIWGNGIGGTSVFHYGKSIFYLSFEPGHLILHPNGVHCSCGQKGCLETYAGGHGIRSQFKKSPTELDDEEWKKVIDSFAEGLVSVIALRTTKLIIFSGGISDPTRIKQLHAAVESKLHIMPVPTFKLATFQKQAALIGSLALIKHLGHY